MALNPNIVNSKISDSSDRGLPCPKGQAWVKVRMDRAARVIPAQLVRELSPLNRATARQIGGYDADAVEPEQEGGIKESPAQGPDQKKRWNRS